MICPQNKQQVWDTCILPLLHMDCWQHVSDLALDLHAEVCYKHSSDDCEP